MERAAFRIRIHPDKVADYVEAHAAVWPDMLAQLTAAGFQNYTIFLDGSTVFGYFEAPDVQAAGVMMAATDVNRRWQEAMSALVEDDLTSGGPALLPEVFRLD